MYNYQEEKKEIFKEENQKDFLKVRDKAFHLMKESGAASMDAMIRGICGSSWTQMAYVDRLVELGEIREITKEGDSSYTWGQHRVFVRWQ